jgi:hypothetical protein
MDLPESKGQNLPDVVVPDNGECFTYGVLHNANTALSPYFLPFPRGAHTEVPTRGRYCSASATCGA